MKPTVSAALLVCGLAVGCTPFGKSLLGAGEEPSTGASAEPTEPARDGANRPAHEEGRRADKRPDLGPCPEDLSFDKGPLRIDMMQRRMRKFRTASAWAAFPWAEGHRQPPSRDFALAVSEAVDRIVAIEDKHPTWVPAGFRAERESKPRDATLRLKMALCLAKDRAESRRASYEATLAFLLGSDDERVEPVLRSSTERSAPSGKYYDSKVSKIELDVEDALTRAVLTKRSSEETSYGMKKFLIGWLTVRHHHCGRQVCSFAMIPGGRASEPVVWDLRDGGFTDPHEQQCRLHTGSASLGSCQSYCGRALNPAKCNQQCLRHCD